jgi:hypothetical protein
MAVEEKPEEPAVAAEFFWAPLTNANLGGSHVLL